MEGYPNRDPGMFLDKDEIWKKKQGYWAYRRVQDVVLSLGALLVLWPFLLLTALVIVLDSPGAGPIFVQDRVGRVLRCSNWRRHGNEWHIGTDGNKYGQKKEGYKPFLQRVEKVRVIPREPEGRFEESSHFWPVRSNIVVTAYLLFGAKIPPRAALGRDDSFFDSLKEGCKPFLLCYLKE